MSRQITVLGIAIMVCYVAAFVKLNQVQVFEASEHNDRPENTRAQLRDFNQPRGDIVSADGAVLATSEERRAALRFQRVYPRGSCSPTSRATTRSAWARPASNAPTTRI